MPWEGMELAEQLKQQDELYAFVQEGLDDCAIGNTRPFAEAMADVKVKRAK